jgi:hypothetical protein
MKRDDIRNRGGESRSPILTALKADVQSSEKRTARAE